MRNVNEHLNGGFFSNVGGSIDSVKKLLSPLFEMKNSHKKRYLDRKSIYDATYDVLVSLPPKFGFNIYKYDRTQTEIIEFIKVTKEEDDLFWVRYSDKKTDFKAYFGHYDTSIAASDVHSFYFGKLPLKIIMTHGDDEVE